MITFLRLHYKLGALNNTDLLSHSARGQLQGVDEGMLRAASSEGSAGGSIPCLSTSLCWVAGHLPRSWMGRSITPSLPSSPHEVYSPYVCIHFQISSVCKDTSHIRSGTTRITHFNWITSGRPSLQINLHSDLTVVKTSTCGFWRDVIQPKTVGVHKR